MWRMLGVWRMWRSHSDVDWRFNAGHRRRVAGSLRLEGGLDSRAGGDTGGAGEAHMVDTVLAVLE